MVNIFTWSAINLKTMEQNPWGGSSGRLPEGPWWSVNPVNESSPTTKHWHVPIKLFKLATFTIKEKGEKICIYYSELFRNWRGLCFWRKCYIETLQNLPYFWANDFFFGHREMVLFFAGMFFTYLYKDASIRWCKLH